MVLAELLVRHTRRHMPTRRVALGDVYLPTSGPAYGAVLLGAVVAEHLPDLDDEQADLLPRLVFDARDGLTVRATERAAQDGGARRRPRATPVDPVLAERARAAAQRLTGLPARVSAGKLELHFGDETRLAELVEALEAL